MSWRHGSGVMLQSGGVWPALRAADMLRHVARLYAHPLPVGPLLERVGLTHVARTPYRRLSGGEQQRLALACALVGRPELVFLDEPTTGLDPQARVDAWQFLRELRAAGVSIVMTTHLLDEAQALADHVVVIDAGRVVAAGTVADLTSAAPALRFRASPGLDLVGLRGALAGWLRRRRGHPRLLPGDRSRHRRDRCCCHRVVRAGGRDADRPVHDRRQSGRGLLRAHCSPGGVR